MNRRPVLTVARREFTTRMVTRSNVISMVVMIAVIVVLGVVAKVFLPGEDEETPAARVGVDPAAGAITAQLAASPEAAAGTLDLVEMDEAAAREALADAESDEHVAAWVSGEPASPRLLVLEEPDPQVLALVEQAARDAVTAQAVESLGGDPAQVRAAVTAVAVTVDTVEEPRDMDMASWLLATVVISLLLFALIGSGSMIAMGVVEEKTSRVVEILLATIRPGQLLAGKVLGIGAYGLFQVVVLGGVVMATVGALGALPGLEVDLGATLVVMVLWFVLGFGVFALLFGGFAALVSRQEDIGAVTTPLMFAMFVPFYVTIFLVPSQPDSTLTKVLSQLPLFAPFMMPVRSSLGTLEAWEMPLSLAITAATIPLLVWVAARVYRSAVLHTGGRMRLGEALRRAR